MTTQKYRKGTFEAKIDSLLPEWESFDVIAHELWADGDGGFSVNDSWHLGRGCDREEAITHLRHRWEVYKVNYEPRARVSGISDENWSGNEFPSLLSAGYPFAEVRNAKD